MNKYTKCFAEYMGYEIVRVGYFGLNRNEVGIDAETKFQKQNKEWIEDVGITEVGVYAVDIKNRVWHHYYQLNYTTSWDWLLDVWKKASSKIYGQSELMAKCMATIFDVDIEKTVKNLYKLINIHHHATETKNE